MGNYDVSFDSDNTWIAHLDGRAYMAGVSPWFFTHYSPQSYNKKNWIYRSDDWMFARRWEVLIANRDKVDIAQIISWNDFGESRYLAPLLQDDSQPMSEAWVNKFPHQGWLNLWAYYIEWYQTGVVPSISRDQVYLWARLYPATADIPGDTVGPPDHREWMEDYLWTIVLLARPADVLLQCGSSREQTHNLPRGLSKLKLPLKTDCSVSAEILRGGEPDVMFEPQDFNFSTKPPMANFNAFVASYP
ncbi:Glycoside hydrolase family 71 protein [Mycena venus]|uniref:Glycoside hydrolase family 71 protein n=1 Tax=Mycena venus TaxID=2733690 RepID=A0A8H6Z2X2_9AGAR|nr:Glycoside hydrolase family 71 protein [Mycena venus]